MNKEIFIEQMNEKYGHNGIFNNDDIIYKASKMNIVCNKCGVINTKSALRHIACTCSKCYSNMSQRGTNETFIKATEDKFGKNKFIFDKLKYANATTKVSIFCVEHNGYFEMTPNKFLSGGGCKVCNKNNPYTTEEFINICKSNYEDLFEYTKTNYVNQKTKVSVYCKNGGHDWVVDPKTLIVGKTGCGECSGKGGRNTEKFIKESKKIHGDKYDYSKVEYVHSEKYVIITCKTDGDFLQQPKAHLTGRGCPKCGKYGYQPSKPGYFYVQKLESEDKVLYKYGITGDMDRRITEQSRNSVFNHTILVERYFEDGKKPLVLEKFLKTYIESGIATPDELQSGFTETFDAKYLEVVLEIVNNFK